MITEKEKEVQAFLEKLNINYTRHEHPPVYTVEEASRYYAAMKGAQCKNLFLRNDRGNRHYLIILEYSKRAELKEIASKAGEKKLSFASSKRLLKYLGLEQGSVSPFGLINEGAEGVIVVLDKDLQQEEWINFHPNVNTATLTIRQADFMRFLEHCGNPLLLY